MPSTLTEAAEHKSLGAATETFPNRYMVRLLIWTGCALVVTALFVLSLWIVVPESPPAGFWISVVFAGILTVLLWFGTVSVARSFGETLVVFEHGFGYITRRTGTATVLGWDEVVAVGRYEHHNHLGPGLVTRYVDYDIAVKDAAGQVARTVQTADRPSTLRTGHSISIDIYWGGLQDIEAVRKGFLTRRPGDTKVRLRNHLRGMDRFGRIAIRRLSGQSI